MPKVSKIPNRVHVNLSANSELIKKAKELGVNMSLLFDAALEREINPVAKEAFTQAQQVQNKKLKQFIKSTHQEKDYDNYKYGGTENVLEKQEGTQKDRQAPRRFEGI